LPLSSEARHKLFLLPGFYGSLSAEFAHTGDGGFRIGIQLQGHPNAGCHGASRSETPIAVHEQPPAAFVALDNISHKLNAVIHVFWNAAVTEGKMQDRK